MLFAAITASAMGGVIEDSTENIKQTYEQKFD